MAWFRQVNELFLRPPPGGLRPWFFIQGRSQPNTADEVKKISGEAKYLSSFLKFEVKNRHKSAKEAKT